MMGLIPKVERRPFSPEGMKAMFDDLSITIERINEELDSLYDRVGMAQTASVEELPDGDVVRY